MQEYFFLGVLCSQNCQELEQTLEQIIKEDRFSGWSKNVNAWINRVRIDNVIRYENLIKGPVTTVGNALANSPRHDPVALQKRQAGILAQ